MICHLIGPGGMACLQAPDAGAEGFGVVWPSNTGGKRTTAKGLPAMQSWLKFTSQRPYLHHAEPWFVFVNLRGRSVTTARCAGWTFAVHQAHARPAIAARAIAVAFCTLLCMAEIHFAPPFRNPVSDSIPPCKYQAKSWLQPRFYFVRTGFPPHGCLNPGVLSATWWPSRAQRGDESLLQIGLVGFTDSCRYGSKINHHRRF